MMNYPPSYMVSPVNPRPRRREQKAIPAEVEIVNVNAKIENIIRLINPSSEAELRQALEGRRFSQDLIEAICEVWQEMCCAQDKILFLDEEA